MANSVLTITHDYNNKLSKDSGYGIIYGWIYAEIIGETATTVTAKVIAYTCGTSASDPWRGPSWSGMNINSGMSWHEANGSYQEWQSADKAFSYNYSDVIESYELVKTFNKRSSEYTVNLYCDTDGSLPNLIDWVVCGTLTVGKIISYPVTYDVDGETVKTLTKYHDTPLTLDCVSPSKEGYTFLGWGSWDGTTPPTQASSDYDNGKIYTGNAELKLRAVWRKNQYDIKYYANKPSGITALSVQNLPSDALAKDWNTDYTIPATKPYLLEYKFLGYATSSTGNVSYQPGTQYKVLQDLNLYAQWKSLYTPPTVSNVRVIRTDTSGTEQDDGTNIKLTFNWSICPAKNEDSSQTAVATTPKYQVFYKKTTETGTAHQYFNAAQSLTGTSGSVDTVLTAVEFEADSAYTIEVRVTESHKVDDVVTTGTASSMTTLTKASYIIDIANQGKRLGLGIAAPDSDGMEIAYQTNFVTPPDKSTTIPLIKNKISGVDYSLGVGIDSLGYMGLYNDSKARWILYQDASRTVIQPPVDGGPLRLFDTVPKLEFVNTTIDTGANSANPSASTYSTIYFRDKSGSRMSGWLQSGVKTDGTVRTSIGARSNKSDSEVSNALYLDVSSTGVRSITVTDDDIWKNGLKVNPKWIFSEQTQTRTNTEWTTWTTYASSWTDLTTLWVRITSPWTFNGTSVDTNTATYFTCPGLNDQETSWYNLITIVKPGLYHFRYHHMLQADYRPGVRLYFTPSGSSTHYVVGECTSSGSNELVTCQVDRTIWLNAGDKIGVATLGSGSMIIALNWVWKYFEVEYLGGWHKSW